MTITVLDDAFDRARADLAAARERLRTTTARADHRVTALLGSGWQGQAAEAFARAYDEWLVSAREVEHGVATMAGLLEQTRSSLARTDAAGAAELDAVTRRLLGEGS
jgi:WXG100 family type VII secretion target